MAPRAQGTVPDAPATAGPACSPAAVVQGPSEIVRPVVAILRGHGVTSGPGACGDRMVNASLATDRDGGGYRLHVRDAVGHSSDRRVADAATAASLIESWALAEDADLWALPTTNPESAQAGVGALATASTLQPADAGHAWRVGLGAEVSYSSDDAVWWGGRVTGWTGAGALRVGGRAGFALTDTRPTLDFAYTGTPDLARALFDLSALVAWPVSADRLWATPSIGLGGAWLRSHASLAPWSATTDDFLARAEVGATAGVRLGGGWSLAADLGGALATALGDFGREGATATYMRAPPRAFLRAGLGVWYAP